jgi:RNA polymerase sigma-70 factor (ECF subfamily)
MELQLSLTAAEVRQEADEADLVHRARSDRQAFAQLYRRHYAMVAGYLLRRVGDVHLAEDLTAEVFLAALRYLPRYRQRGLPIRAWLYRIASNSVSRWVRRERRRIARSLADLESAESASGMTESRHDERDGEFVRLAVLSLPPKYQAVLTLHYLEGLNLEERVSSHEA